MLSYIPYSEIDTVKWDACIDKAHNGLLYVRSFYLDNMAANWDGLVWNDYQAVMPLTWKKKLQIKYLYQPAFSQQGGIFSREPLSEDVTNLFLKEAFSHFKFAEITLNYANTGILPGKYLSFSLRTNFIVALSRPYEDMYGQYDPSFTKSLRRIKKFNIEYSASENYPAIIQLYKDLYSKRLPYFSNDDFINFEKICSIMAAEGNVITRLAHDPGKELLAAVVLLKDGDRLYNMVSCITAEGKKIEANYYLYDKIIEEFANSGLVLDLEGSDVKGIAGFYKKFNPASQPYPFIKYNGLNPLIKLFKP